MHQASSSTSRDELRQRVRQQVAGEKELVLEPAFFAALSDRFPEISHVEVRLKRGHARNEMTQFRYDVIIHVGGVTPVTAPQWLDWQESGVTLSAIRQRLAESRPQLLGVQRVRKQSALRVIKGDACFIAG